MKNIPANITDPVYPDYCVGFLYTMMPDTALGNYRIIIIIIIITIINSMYFSSGTNLTGSRRKIDAKHLF